MTAPALVQPVGGPTTLGPQDRAQAGRWLLAALAGFILGQACALILASIGAAIAGTPGGLTALLKFAVPPSWLVATELLGLWAGFGSAALVVTRTGRSLGVRFRVTDIWFVLLGIGLQLAGDAVYAPFHLKGLSKPTEHLLGGGSGWALVVPGVLTVLGAPFFEELYFRGVLLRGLTVALRTSVRAIGLVSAIAIDATLFGLAHLGNDTWVELPGLVALGAVLCALALRTGRLGPSMVTHATFNLLAVVSFAAQR